MRSVFPRRTIHLDFHTAPHIPDVGRDFDPDEFASTLADAHVDSVTLCAKCHHGHLYFRTDRPERHPGLPRELDLLGEQIEALHRRGIRTPVYMSVLVDEYAANQHPHWCAIDAENRRVKRRAGVFDAGWQVLDMSSPYQEYLADQIAEVLSTFAPLDGLFLDMCWDQCSCSPWAIDGMRKRGYDPVSEVDRRRYASEVTHSYMARFKRMVDQAHKGQPSVGIWFNSRSKCGLYREKSFIRHIEVECLPGGGWGYAYLPYVGRLVKPLGLPVASHTARFHRGWGDFGTLKSEAALMYECCSMLSQDIACGVGDQMHPRGVLDKEAYLLIGKVYRHIENCERWTTGGQHLSEAAVVVDLKHGDRPGPCALGMTRLLQELHVQYDLITTNEMELNPQILVIVPDNIKANGSLRTALARHIQRGGRVIFSGDSALDMNGNPLMPEMGIRAHGPSPYSVTYLRPSQALASEIGQGDWAMYERGFRMTACHGGRSLCRVVEPYFERRFDMFCSHAQTPPDRLTRYAGAVRKGNIVTFSVPLFTAYGRHGNPLCRFLLRAALRRLLPQPLVSCEGPVHLETTVVKKGNRTVVHLLSFTPGSHTEDPAFQTVDDPFPLIDVPLSLKLDRAPRRVLLIPENIQMPFDCHGGRVHLRVSSAHGHAMIVFE